MNLHRFLIGVGDSRWVWHGISRWKPRPAERFTGLRVLGLAVWGGAIGAVIGALGCGLLAVNPRTAGAWWPVVWVGSLGLVISGLMYALIAVAWNSRASRLAAAGLTDPPPLPPTRWWQRWLLGPFYALTLFLITPLALLGSFDYAWAAFAWNRVRAELEARGEPLTPNQLLGPPPAPEENFALTPLLRPVTDYRIVVTNERSELVWLDPTGRIRLRALQVPPAYRPPGERRATATNDGRLNLDRLARGIRAKPLKAPPGLPPDLVARYGMVSTNPASLTDEQIRSLPIANPGAEVLAYLRRFDPEMQEIAEAARRPRSRFPNPWFEGNASFPPALSPHIPLPKNLSTLFRIRMAARLSQGDAQGAFEDTLTGFRLAVCHSEEPLLLSLLVRIAQNQIAIAAAWEGLVARRWSDDQLAVLQLEFGRLDFREPTIRAFQGERVLGDQMYEQIIGSGAGTPALAVRDEQRGDEAIDYGYPRLPWYAPRGMFRRNQIHQHRLYDQLQAQLRDPAWPANQAPPLMGDALLRKLGFLPITPYVILPSMLAPAIEKTSWKAARQNVTARLGETACALERHRLATGQYPERLEELAPRFLPRPPLDPMNGQPLRYGRTDEGWYRLWSVGLNGRDDGGRMTSPVDNDREGDWVWPVPVPSTEPRLFGG